MKELQDRNTCDWYLAAHTKEQTRTVTVAVDFLQEGDNYLAQIYRDGDNADYEKDPYDLVIEERMVTSNQTLTFNLGRSGGAVVRLVKQSH